MNLDTAILVPTRGRTHAPINVLTKLPIAVKDMPWDVIMCCPAEEVAHWSRHTFALEVPVSGIGPTRQWLTEKFQHLDVVLMMDDDIHFCARPDMSSPKLFPATAEQLIQGLTDMMTLAHLYGACSMSARSGNNHTERRIEFNSRSFTCYAFRPSLLLEEDIRWDALHLMEDFYVFLSLMVRGYSVPKLCDLCFDQPQSNSAGGCSLYRNQETQKQAAMKLAAFFPDFVKVATKQTKGNAWFGGDGTRTDVTIQWKKAAEFGQTIHKLI